MNISITMNKKRLYNQANDKVQQARKFFSGIHKTGYNNPSQLNYFNDNSDTSPFFLV